MISQTQSVRIEALRQEIARLERGWRPRKAQATSSGCRTLDAILPEGGFRGGTLVEWLADGDGTGVATLAFAAACRACRSGGGLIVVDQNREFYPPAAIGLGIEPAQLIVVHPQNKADHDWALDQSLRWAAVAAVVAWPDAQGGTLAGRTFRRLQLAAEEGGGLGLLIRPATARSLPSWADVRLLVEPLRDPRPSSLVPASLVPGAPSHHGRRQRWQGLLLRCRGISAGLSCILEIDDETHPVLDLR
jgi:protein ImuA